MQNRQIDLLKVKREQVSREYTTPNPPHRHAQWELLIMEKGICINVVNGKEYSCSQGDVLLLGPHHLHEIRPTTSQHLHRDIYFSDTELHDICRTYSPDFYDALCGNETVLSLSLAPNIYETVQHLCANLDTLAIAEQTEKSTAIGSPRAISHSILHLIFGLYYSQSAIHNIDIPPILLETLHNLQLPEYFTQKVDEIVSRTNYSHSQFLKIFKQYTGVPIIQYVNRARLNYAAELLRHTDNTVLYICEQSGYDSLSFFIKSFKKQYGKTPLQYRKEPTVPRH